MPRFPSKADTALAAVTVALAGCALEQPGAKEVFVERRDALVAAPAGEAEGAEAEGAPAAGADGGGARAAAGLGQLSAGPFPVDPAAEPETFSVVRAVEPPDAAERVRALLGRYAADAEAGPEDAPPLVLHARGLPPEGLAGGAVSFAGHCAFARHALGSDPVVVHHVRLLLVNDRPWPLAIVPGSIQLAGDGGEPLAPVALADEEGYRLQRAVAEPRGVVLVHAFFEAERLDQRLTLSWRVAAADPGSGAGGPWPLEVPLRRAYAIAEGVFSPLEERVQRGEALPERYAPPDPWREPVLDAIPGPPAAPGE